MRAVRSLWVVIFRPDQQTVIDEGAALQRMVACTHCPIFDHRWKACGNGKRRLENGEFVGCLCYMPMKVHFTRATCWLHDQGVTDKGWPQKP